MHVFAVREIAAYLKELLESSSALNDLWVAGEVSNVSRPAPRANTGAALKNFIGDSGMALLRLERRFA